MTGAVPLPVPLDVCELPSAAAKPAASSCENCLLSISSGVFAVVVVVLKKLIGFSTEAAVDDELFSSERFSDRLLGRASLEYEWLLLLVLLLTLAEFILIWKWWKQWKENINCCCWWLSSVSNGLACLATLTDWLTVTHSQSKCDEHCSELLRHSFWSTDNSNSQGQPFVACSCRGESEWMNRTTIAKRCNGTSTLVNSGE